MKAATVTLQLVPNKRVIVTLPETSTVGDVLKEVQDAFGPATSAGVRIVLKGTTLPAEKPEATVTLKDGDTLLIAPLRKAPPTRLVAAVAGHDDEDEEPAAALPAGAAQWEALVVEYLRRNTRLPPWAVEWVVVVRPRTIALFIAFWIGAAFAARLGFGPVYILASIIITIFTNLGTRRQGEASAYSIFNNFRRLPGQLDADEVDRQMRRGQLG